MDRLWILPESWMLLVMRIAEGWAWERCCRYVLLALDESKKTLLTFLSAIHSFSGSFGGD